MSTERIIFIHIPKAAGQTIHAIVGRQYRRDEILILGERVGQVSPPTIEQAAGAKIILGHVHFGLHQYLDGENTYVTFLREPVSRVLSLYRYIATSTRHHLHAQVVNTTLIDFVSGQLDAEEVENGQVRQIAGLTRGAPDASDLARAKQNLVQACRVVGLVERFDESIILLKKSLGWRMPFYVRKNVTQAASSDSSDDQALHIIKRRNALDIELYQFACDLFEEQIRRESFFFPVEVSVFRALNATARLGRAGMRAASVLRSRNA
jgi:Galactose-3-O-sulfotransferase